MTPPNRNALWAELLVEELAAAGVDAVCVAPGSRSTPLTVACYEHDGIEVFSHLDERSAAYFALGRARRTGTPTPLICTSGTAAANFHPAVLEADGARVPMLLLTADRPPELRDSGANQTVDQVDLYGDAVRWFRDLPEPEPAERKLRRLRVDVARAVATATGTPAGPVHLNVPFRKPLEPVDVDDPALDAALERATGRAARDTDSGPNDRTATERPASVRTHCGTTAPHEEAVEDVADAVAAADRVLVVAGPAAPDREVGAAAATIARATGAPLLADPLSGARFGPHVADVPLVCGGYDGYLGTAAADRWPAPELVVRLGASATSKSLRNYLAGTAARQVLVDPAGEWRDAEFASTDLLIADPAATADALVGALERRGVDPDDPARERYRVPFERAEAAHWALTESAVPDGVAGRLGAGDAGAALGDDPASGRDGRDDPDRRDSRDGRDGRDDRDDRDDHDDHDDLVDVVFEGAVVPAVLAAVPDDATLFASNSMPVRDLDRFAPPSTRSLDALANRGASGIDGITSTALGAASAGGEPLVAVVGDLAYYHDANGLLAADRCGVDATIVLVNNDGGGIFHALPIESFDPPFTEGFRTPHGLDFEPTADLYDLAYRRVDLTDLPDACEEAIGRDGVDVLEVAFDAESSHRTREALAAALDDRLRGLGEDGGLADDG